MSSSVTSPGLAQEIFDEFLLCKICFSAYKSPKSLLCLHVFCCKCIDDQFKSPKSSFKVYADYREFTCPLCYRRTPVPSGGANMLPDNFTVSRLMALIGPRCSVQSPAAVSCSICRKIGHKHREAVSRCVECSKLLCADCAKEHRETKVTSGHSLFGIHVEKDIQCKEHADEAVRFYCSECEDPICVLCTFNQKHTDHSLVQLSEAVSSCKDRIQSLLTTCKRKTTDCDQRLNAISRCEDTVALATQKIRETADRLTQEVRQAEARLHDQLHRMVGPETMQQLETKKDLVAVLEGMKSTCDIADIIVAGKDMELLLLKKDVETKLNSINAIQLPALPPQQRISQLDFCPGSVDVGYLHDDKMTSWGCSGSSKTRKVTKSSSGLDEASCRESATQTEDCKLTEDGLKCNVDSQKRPLATLPVMTVSVRVSPPRSRVDQNEQNGVQPRRRRKRDPSLTKVNQ